MFFPGILFVCCKSVSVKLEFNLMEINYRRFLGIILAPIGTGSALEL